MARTRSAAGVQRHEAGLLDLGCNAGSKQGGVSCKLLPVMLRARMAAGGQCHEVERGLPGTDSTVFGQLMLLCAHTCADACMYARACVSAFVCACVHEFFKYVRMCVCIVCVHAHVRPCMCVHGSMSVCMCVHWRGRA